MEFFRYFPTTSYTSVNGNTITQSSMTNITLHARIAERLLPYQSSFYDYVIRDDERPDMVAQNLYGSTDYTWVILLTNNIFSLYDWPLTNTEFAEYIADKYGSIDVAQQTIVEYYDISNTLIDASTYTLLPAGYGTTRSAYDVELAQNEAKRVIRVVQSQFIGSLAQSLRTLFI